MKASIMVRHHHFWCVYTLVLFACFMRRGRSKWPCRFGEDVVIGETAEANNSAVDRYFPLRTFATV